jgi:hypothetical protein
MNVLLKSDWYWVREMSLRPDELNEYEIYKACAALSSTGFRRPEEQRLGPALRSLLEVRRILQNGDLKKAETVLTEKMVTTPKDSSFILGEVLSLMALLEHRQNRIQKAQSYFEMAAEAFRECGETNRAMRSVTNAFICSRDQKSNMQGELLQLERTLRSKGVFDLVGNIKKTRTIELMVEGNFAAALTEIEDAVECYEKDGCPEDFAISQCLLTMNLLIDGNIEDARSTRSRVVQLDGKVAPFVEACDSLFEGRLPSFPTAHPMFPITWPRARLKAESVTGKVLMRLRSGPATKENLIRYIWGPTAMGPSYNSRLYSAISEIRKKSPIVFDGNFYRIT